MDDIEWDGAGEGEGGGGGEGEGDGEGDGEGWEGMRVRRVSAVEVGVGLR